MSAAAGARRGQPLLVLLALVGGWVGARAMDWQAGASAAAADPPAGAPAAAYSSAYSPASGPAADVGPQSFPEPPGQAFSPSPYGPPPYAAAPYPASPYPQAAYALPAYPPVVARPQVIYVVPPGGDHASSGSAAPAVASLPAAPRTGAAQRGVLRFFGLGPEQGLSLADRSFGGDTLPPLRDALASPGADPAAAMAARPPRRARRLTGEAWALLRRDGVSGPITNGALPATYGSSQAGAVLRYDFGPRGTHHPSAYLRTTSSMGQARQTALALGLSARPLAHVPVTAAIEGRLVEGGGGRSFQGAAMVIAAPAPIALPLGLRADAYAQGGYVAGRYATPFADGQLRVDRAIFDLGRFEPRLGGGIWGGYQKGAARLDAGPSMSLAFPLARGAYGRLAFDWRFRLAGDAQPGSGPALTLSAGF